MECISMKLNPYPVLLTTGALMLATVVFAQTGSKAASLLKVETAVIETPASDEAKHPDTRLASLDGKADRSGARTLEN
jgi:hypothetical protein